MSAPCWCLLGAVAADSSLIDLIRLISRLIEKESVGCHLALGTILSSLRGLSHPRSICRIEIHGPFRDDQRLLCDTFATQTNLYIRYRFNSRSVISIYVAASFTVLLLLHDFIYECSSNMKLKCPLTDGIINILIILVR